MTNIKSRIHDIQGEQQETECKVVI